MQVENFYGKCYLQRKKKEQEERTLWNKAIQMLPP